MGIRLGPKGDDPNVQHAGKNALCQPTHHTDFYEKQKLIPEDQGGQAPLTLLNRERVCLSHRLERFSRLLRNEDF